jgi:hypothetical protein
MRVEPVSPYPPSTSRVLEQWLDPAYAAQVSPWVQTRLREIAHARAMRTGMWSALLSLGASAVVFEAALYAVNGNPRMLVWALAGAAVVLFSLLMLRRGRYRLGRSGVIHTTRGPRSLRGGLLAAGGIFLAINVFLLPTLVNSGRLLSIAFIDFGALLVLVSVFVIPATILERARPTLRRAAKRHPRLLDALEQERLRWPTRTGSDMVFGPL